MPWGGRGCEAWGCTGALTALGGMGEVQQGRAKGSDSKAQGHPHAVGLPKK